MADGQLLSLCVLLSSSLILVTIEITDEMVAVVCVCSDSHRGMGSFPVSACVWCLQPAFDKQGKVVITLRAKR